ncbi:helix-turn-helix transcriptional regulator [Alicyclobacillus vulcanalis]|uniref:Helix-turn-helix domain-containing protein n=1 Tax=Alicyclobacillus vulcanalis TaxID=252246 RepID=A0A1N7M3G3_9BACL|nr:AraC family transcriptional regulator [Alicyclobacillus vulcanalis]SIS80655.1 Helix-turn-helix domain-containing protein [Alicyclobacillus vulcanalis]
MSVRMPKKTSGPSSLHAIREVRTSWPSVTWDVLQQHPVELDFQEVKRALDGVRDRQAWMVVTVRSSRVVPIYPFLAQIQSAGFDCVHLVSCDAAAYVMTLAAHHPERAMEGFEAALARLAADRTLVGVSAASDERDVARWWQALMEATNALHWNVFEACAFSQGRFELAPLNDEERMRLIARAVMQLGDRGYEGIASVVEDLFSQLAERPAKLEDVAELCGQLIMAAVGQRQADGRDRMLQIPTSTRQWLRFVAEKCPKWWDWRDELKHALTVVLGREEAGRTAHSAQIGQVIEMIERHYDSDLDVATLASRVYLSPSYLSKRFKSETGMTIREFIVQTRLNKAKDLLLRDFHLKAYEVGAHVGYPDPTYFNKLFKRQVGLTPKAFRDRAMRQVRGLKQEDSRSSS